jgi:ketosteroid isomerase-like protein
MDDFAGLAKELEEPKKAAPEDTRTITGGSMNDREELSAALDQIIQSGMGGRTEGLARILDDQIVMVFPGFGRQAQGKDTMLGGFKDFAANAEVLRHRETDEQIDIIGDAAVASYHFEIIYAREGTTYRSTGRDLWFFIDRRAAGWRCGGRCWRWKNNP